MKKRIVLFLIFVMTLSLIACGNKVQPTDAEQSDVGSKSTEKAATYEIAMILGIGGLEQSLNRETWQGITAYAKQNKLTCQYYAPQSATTSSWMTAIEEAVKGGAKIIITPGMCFEEAVYKAQDLYPEAFFVLIDGEPHDDADSDYKTANNTTCIIYAEQQAGYLAGYAAVQEGFTNIGFMGGMQTPQIERFGYGFLKGADDAAIEKGVFVQSRYTYVGTYTASPEVQTTAAAWYTEGTELIFSCGGQIVESIIAAAEADAALGTVDEAGVAKRSAVINVDSMLDDDTSNVVITAALKGIDESVQQVLTEYYEGEFPAAKTRTVTASDNGVGLPMEQSNFKNFTKTQYDDIFGRLAAGGIQIPVDTSVESADQLVLSNTTVIIS